MDSEPGTSKEKNEQQQQCEMRQWTKELKTIPPFTFELMQKHLGTNTELGEENNVGAHKHKKEGYQLFKDKYVKQVVIKANVMKDKQMYYLVKGCVDASMKKMVYTVYIHLNQDTGEVAYASCKCKAGKGGCCKHVVALMFQIIEYIQLELKEIPDDLTCTQLLQQWHVPRNDELNEPILYEDVVFERASYEKDKSGKKRKNLKTCDSVINPAPQYSQNVTSKKIEGLVLELKNVKKANYLCKLLESNKCQPHGFEQIHKNLPSKKKCTEAKENACDLNDNSLRYKVLKGLETVVANLASLSDENIDLVQDELSKTHGQLLEIEKNTRGQSTCEQWYEERNIRLTASNFGSVIKRRKSIYPKSILSHILGSKVNMHSPKQCIWGNENELKAVDKYYKLKKEDGCPVTMFAQVGFVVNPEYPWLGASPDFLIGDSKEASPYGIGEVKCPFSKREMTIEEACATDKTFYLTFCNGKVTLKQNHAYYYQVQGIMATLRTKWSDFIVLTNKDLHVERIYFDSVFWEGKMLPELTSFYFQYLAPKLHGEFGDNQ